MKLTSCLVNPRACRETELNYEKVILPKRIAVVGAGPAGISFSIVAAQRGHEVSLFDENHEIGGQLNFAKMIPGKEEFYGLLDFYKNENYFTYKLIRKFIGQILKKIEKI